MPIYEYQCDGCSQVFEVFQKVSDPAPAQHSCGSTQISRILSNTSFVLKGTGWYITDYARKGKGGEGESGKGGESGGSESGKSSGESGKSGGESGKAEGSSTATPAPGNKPTSSGGGGGGGGAAAA
jgi:putative FmdB family regulatory protein